MVLKILSFLSFTVIFFVLVSPSTHSLPLNNAANTDYQDIVTVQDDLPQFLKLDPFSGKYVFQLSKFDIDSIITTRQLNEKEFVKSFTWAQFNRSATDLMANVYSKLTEFYKSELSSKFRREICATLSSKLPVMEKKYYRLRKKSIKETAPSLSRNVQKLESLSVINCVFVFYI